MIVTLSFMAVIGAVIGSWLFTQKLGAKPWLEVGVEVDIRGAESILPTPKMGLVVFLTVATALFAMLCSGYYMRLKFADWSALPEPQLLWFNTGLLILGSIVLQWAQIGARQGKMGNVRFGFLGAGVFAVAFLVGQSIAWQDLIGLGYFAAGNPASAFFYLLTAIHAAHVVGGVIAWGRTGVKLLRGASAEQIRMSIDLCTIYWHFLLVIWLAMFGLLLAT